NVVGRNPSERDVRFMELVTSSLVSTLDDKQTGHGIDKDWALVTPSGRTSGEPDIMQPDPRAARPQFYGGNARSGRVLPGDPPPAREGWSNGSDRVERLGYQYGWRCRRAVATPPLPEKGHCRHRTRSGRGEPTRPGRRLRLGPMPRRWASRF